jgi:putative ABC transport system permease protein
MRSGNFSTAEVFQESLRSLKGIKKVDGSSFYLDNIETKELFEIETEEGRKKMLVAYLNCGYEFLDAMGIQIIKGRNFMKDRSTDSFGAYIINETAAKAFGWKDPIGRRIWGPVGSDRTDGEVIGVVRDFNFASLHSEIEPLIIFPVAEGWGIDYVYAKLNPIRPPDLISTIAGRYKKIYRDSPFEWEYLDSKYQSLYREDLEIRNIFQVGLIISVLVSSLGIFSISAFMAIMRAKEMGIRKVVGANPLQLFVLHLRRFIRFIFISFLIASPAIYYLSHHWLNNFAYHIELTSWYFIVPCLIALLIVFITSGYHGVKSSQINPVDILKEE